jgi:hypothetical protein
MASSEAVLFLAFFAGGKRGFCRARSRKGPRADSARVAAGDGPAEDVPTEAATAEPIA